MRTPRRQASMPPMVVRPRVVLLDDQAVDLPGTRRRTHDRVGQLSLAPVRASSTPARPDHPSPSDCGTVPAHAACRRLGAERTPPSGTRPGSRPSPTARQIPLAHVTRIDPVVPPARRQQQYRQQQGRGPATAPRTPLRDPHPLLRVPPSAQIDPTDAQTPAGHYTGAVRTTPPRALRFPQRRPGRPCRDRCTSARNHATLPGSPTKKHSGGRSLIPDPKIVTAAALTNTS